MYKKYFVYIITNFTNNVLYTGVTNNIERRMWEHKVRSNPVSFSSKYYCYKLVWYEEFNDIKSAIENEKKIKNWRRQWKIDLITNENPEWKDLSNDWFTEDDLKYEPVL